MKTRYDKVCDRISKSKRIHKTERGIRGGRTFIYEMCDGLSVIEYSRSTEISFKDVPVKLYDDKLVEDVLNRVKTKYNVQERERQEKILEEL